MESNLQVKKEQESDYLAQTQRYESIICEQKEQEEASPQIVTLKVFKRAERVHQKARMQKENSEVSRHEVHILMNFADLQDKEIKRLQNKLHSLSKELTKAKTELNVVREDRDFWIKMNADKQSSIYALDLQNKENFAKLNEQYAALRSDLSKLSSKEL